MNNLMLIVLLKTARNFYKMMNINTLEIIAESYIMQLKEI